MRNRIEILTSYHSVNGGVNNLQISVVKDNNFIVKSFRSFKGNAIIRANNYANKLIKIS